MIFSGISSLLLSCALAWLTSSEASPYLDSKITDPSLDSSCSSSLFSSSLESGYIKTVCAIINQRHGCAQRTVTKQDRLRHRHRVLWWRHTLSRWDSHTNNHHRTWCLHFLLLLLLLLFCMILFYRKHIPCCSRLQLFYRHHFVLLWILATLQLLYVLIKQLPLLLPPHHICFQVSFILVSIFTFFVMPIIIIPFFLSKLYSIKILLSYCNYQNLRSRLPSRMMKFAFLHTDCSDFFVTLVYGNLASCSITFLLLMSMLYADCRADA